MTTSPPVIIRAYRDADLQPLRAIFNEVIAAGDAFVYDAPFTTDQMSAYLTACAATFVAERAGEIIGGYILKPNHPGRGSHVCNAAYVVSNRAKGFGVGRAMGEHSLVEAKRLGFTSMQFTAVVAANEPAVKLWTRLGFETIGTVPRAFRHADGRMVDFLIMHRNL